jgi:C4-type Zn-finger protein
MASLELHTRRSAEVDDQSSCPQCGGTMHANGRDPRPEHSAYAQPQTFICYVCRYESPRHASSGGELYH